MKVEQQRSHVFHMRVGAEQPVTDSTLPFSWYTDPEIHEAEFDRIFHHCWQYIGRADKVSSPGDIVVGHVGDVPVVVTRDRDGVLRGFVNVCRHRGFRVMRDDCNRKTMTCPYHGWTYELDGRLRNAPRSEH